VNDNGFVFETHPVITEDGYILSVFRITKDGFTKPGAPVVFLQHGITDSADCWIMNNNLVAPAFQLVRSGYDVWLGNQRGTKYSKGHMTLDAMKDKAYWEFSFTEMGKFDAPAQIDFVRLKTGAEKVTYIGHSQGTTQMFYAISER
jgi:pimeloyl-ACP methyl ester carboxylesterase